MKKLKLRWVITNNRHNLVRIWAKIKPNIIMCTNFVTIKKQAFPLVAGVHFWGD